MKNVKNKLRKIVVSAVIASIVLPMGSGNISFKNTNVIAADTENGVMDKVIPVTSSAIYTLKKDVKFIPTFYGLQNLSKETTAEREMCFAGSMRYTNNMELSNPFIVADGNYNIKYIDLDGNEYASCVKSFFDEKISESHTTTSRAHRYANLLAPLKASGYDYMLTLTTGKGIWDNGKPFLQTEAKSEFYEELKSYNIYEYVGYTPMRDSKHQEARDAWNTMRQLLKDAPRGKNGVEYGYTCYVPNITYTQEDIEAGRFLQAEDTQCVCIMLYKASNPTTQMMDFPNATVTYINNEPSLLPLHGMGTTLKSSYNMITGKTEKATIFEYNNNEIITSEDDKRNLTDRTNEATWTSSNEDIISVENGVIKAKKQGTATITVTYGDCSYSSKVTSYKKNKKPAKKVYKSTKGKDVTLKLNDYTGVAHIQWMTRGMFFTKKLLKQYPKAARRIKKGKSLYSLYSEGQGDIYKKIMNGNLVYGYYLIFTKDRYSPSLGGQYVFDKNNKRMELLASHERLNVLESNLTKANYNSGEVGSPLCSYITAYMDKNNTICKLKISKSAYKRFKKRYDGEKTWEYSYTFGKFGFAGWPTDRLQYSSGILKEYKGKDLSTKNIYAKVTYLDGTIEMIPFTYVLTK